MPVTGVREMQAIEERSPTEYERVIGWRCLQLIEAGMECSRARRLSERENWRDAIDLMDKGCPEHLAFNIVR
jgi:hypothetical protein